MFSLPSSRHCLLPALSLLAIVLFIRAIHYGNSSSTHTLLTKILQASVQRGIEIPIEEIQGHGILLRSDSGAVIPSQKEDYYTSDAPSSKRQQNSYLAPLLTCRLTPNPHTNHIRLPIIVRNITHSTPAVPNPNPAQRLFNPTILALPPWSRHHYLLVSRVVTEGLHQESLLCFADLCHHPNATAPHGPDSTPCSEELLGELGFAGGMHCATPPKVLSIPPTPSLRCAGAWEAFPAIPGFHDPRVFWSGRGEPLILVNSASQYACVGLWVVDLRVLEPALKTMLQGHGTAGGGGAAGPAMSYSSLTELTRNPAADRGAVEKNWFLFFGDEASPAAGQSPSPGQSHAANGADEAFVHYDMFANHPHNSHRGNHSRNNTAPAPRSGGRSFAKLLGHGLSTPNLTDPLEPPCRVAVQDARGRAGHWHQASNALKLVLCSRAEARRRTCGAVGQAGRVVNFAVVHRKFSNEWALPLRYERYFVVWEGRRPYRVLGISRFPVLLWNETASGWGGEENWVGEMGLGWNGSIGVRAEFRMGNETKYAGEGLEGNVGENWAYFTYTPSIAWAWRPRTAQGRRRDARGGDGFLRSMHVGYLDDEVIVGIGLEDTKQAFAKATAETLLQCLRTCSMNVEGDDDEGSGNGEN